MDGIGGSLRGASARVVHWFFELNQEPGARTPLTPRAASRVSAAFFWAAGVYLLLTPWLPASSGTPIDTAASQTVGAVAVASGVVVLLVPWPRLPWWASLSIRVPMAAALIALSNHYGGLSPYRYSLYFCYLATMIGLCQPRWSTIRCLPLLATAYVAPLIAAGAPSWSYWGLLQVLPIVAVIGEGIAYFGSLAARALVSAETRASTDPLTGLANRAAFRAFLTSACRPSPRERTASVIYLDLDGFKPVNDRLGHQAGDDVLRAVADRLTRSARATDQVARLGGDEFAVLLPEVDGRAGAEQVVQRMIEAIGQPITVDGDEVVSVGASAGVTIFVPGEAEPDEVLRRSDAAMYDAKQAGGGRMRVASAEPAGSPAR